MAYRTCAWRVKRCSPDLPPSGGKGREEEEKADNTTTSEDAKKEVKEVGHLDQPPEWSDHKEEGIRSLNIKEVKEEIEKLRFPWEEDRLHTDFGGIALHPFTSLALELTPAWQGEPLKTICIYTDGSFDKKREGLNSCTWAFVLVGIDQNGDRYFMGTQQGRVHTQGVATAGATR